MPREVWEEGERFGGGKWHLKHFSSCQVFCRWEWPVCYYSGECQGWRYLSFSTPLFTELASLRIIFSPGPSAVFILCFFVIDLHSVIGNICFIKKVGSRKAVSAWVFPWRVFEHWLLCPRPDIASTTALLLLLPCQTLAVGSPSSKQLQKLKWSQSCSRCHLCSCTAFSPVNGKKTTCEALNLSDSHLCYILKYGTIASGSDMQVSWRTAIPNFLIFKLV